MQENALQHEADTPAQEDFKQKAVEKLNTELEKNIDKQFAPLISYLIERCKDDNGLAQDVMQSHKTFKKCLSYCYDQARKQSSGNIAMVKGDVVFEWAEDYYHKDDKKIEEEKAERAKKQEDIRKKAEKQRKEREAKASGKAAIVNQKAAKPDKRSESAAPKAEPQKPKKDPKEMEGQMDLFSMMGL